MPCRLLKLENDFTVIVCGLPRRKRCYYCGRLSEHLCDFPVVVKTWLGIKKTCDRALCGNCKMSGASENVDFCRHHYPLAVAAHERRLKQAA